VAGIAGDDSCAAKADYLQKLVVAGFTTIDAVSLFPPRLFRKWRTPSRCLRSSMSGERGDHWDRCKRKGRRACHQDRHSADIGLSIFHLAGVSAQESEAIAGRIAACLESVIALAEGAERNVVAYVSMAFGTHTAIHSASMPWSMRARS